MLDLGSIHEFSTKMNTAASTLSGMSEPNTITFVLTAVESLLASFHSGSCPVSNVTTVLSEDNGTDEKSKEMLVIRMPC